MNILIKLTIDFLKKEKFKTIFIIILSCFLNILKINIISYITANIIKSIENKNINNVYTFYKYFIGISIIFIIFYYLYKNLQNYFISKLRQVLTFDIIKLLFINNNDNLSEQNFTKLNTSIFRSSNNCFYLMVYAIDKLLPNVTLLLIIFVYFFYNNIIFGLIFLVGNLIACIYIYYIWDNILELNRIAEYSLLDNESVIVEILNNFDKIIYRGESKSELNNLWELSKEVIKKTLTFYKKSTTDILILNIIIFVTIFILIYYLIYLFSKNKINSTIFITFITILLLYRDILLSSIQEIPEYAEYLNRIKIADKIFENRKIIYDNNDSDISKLEIDLKYNSILFKNINYKYKKTNKYILNNFNLKIDTNNKIIGITGSSGKGKSTLVKLLIKLYKFEGDIYIDDINIKNIQTDYIRKNILYVNQNSKLFDKKIIENLLYGCSNKSSYEKLKYILNYNKIKELYKNINFNKNAGLSGEKLSGGQRQVVNIINGLISDSKIVILDEPTNALDIELKKEIIEIIKYFKKFKKCIIIISHDSDIYSIFDETIEIK